jgi:hypothetical protein
MSLLEPPPIMGFNLTLLLLLGKLILFPDEIYYSTLILVYGSILNGVNVCIFFCVKLIFFIFFWLGIHILLFELERSC